MKTNEMLRYLSNIHNIIKIFISFSTILLFTVIIKLIFFEHNIDKYQIILTIVTLFSVIVFLSRIFIDITYNKNKISNFLDIDNEKNSNNKEFNYKDVPKRSPVTEGELANIFSYKYNSFETYFNTIIIYLDNQISISDKKASLLLNKGINMAIAGITIYFIIIFIWQYLIYLFGFKNQYLYGIISTSLLFIFVEFFSAWFLRQYRSYVDTSTYLVKIKSILQRYVLAYLALKDGKEKDFDVLPIITMLQDEIKWPETYLIKKPDINFAKECLETATNLIKSVQNNNKSQEEK